jgi:hypothetical protein
MYTLESILQIAERYKELHQEKEMANSGRVIRNLYEDAYWQKYQKLGGKLSEDLYKEYVAFFLHIFAIVCTGDGYQIGLSREEAAAVWNGYLQVKGIKASKSAEEANRIFSSVDLVHPLS